MEFNIGKHIVSLGLDKVHDYKLGLSLRYDRDGQYLQLLVGLIRHEFVLEIQLWL